MTSSLSLVWLPLHSNGLPPWDNSLFLNFNDLIFDLLGWRGVLTGSDSVMKVSWCVCSGQIYVTRGTIGLILFQMLSHFLTRNNTAYNGHSQPGDLGRESRVHSTTQHYTFIFYILKQNNGNF